MYALDTNLLVYAHNTVSPFHAKAKTFIEDIMNESDDEGQLTICIPAQVLMEFLNVITWHRLEAPLPLADAIQIVQDYLDTGGDNSVSTTNAIEDTAEFTKIGNDKEEDFRCSSSCDFTGS